MQKLISALIAAQKEFPVVVKDSTNPHFKNRYADLDTVCSTVNPVLRKHGLIIVQVCGGDTLKTILYHESGDFISGEQNLHPVKNDPQGWHGAMTYARRYGILGVVGISSSDDDDGNAASEPEKPKKDALPAVYLQFEGADSTIRGGAYNGQKILSLNVPQLQALYKELSLPDDLARCRKIGQEKKITQPEI